MRRYRDDRPADICLARGTFNSHPYVMGAMHEFLRRFDTPEIQQLYDGLDERWNARAAIAQRHACDGRPAGPRRQSVLDLDGELYAALPL